MDESEKRARSVVARRQQQHHTTPTTNITLQNKTPQHRPNRIINDFMMVVAAGLSARNSNLNLVSGGLGQATTSSGVVLPKHLDFSFRDRSDVTAKRRFQVKVPYGLMIVLALVFLILPGLIFIHKELHIHDEHYQSHFKTEKYINVDTKGVWDNFRLATTTDGIVQHEVGENATTTREQTRIKEEYHSGDFTSDLHNYTLAKSVAGKNQPNPLPSTMDHYNIIAEFTEGGMNGDESYDHNLAHDDESSVEVNSASIDQGNHD